MARNRKRAKDRRARRPAAAQVGRGGYAASRDEPDEAPSPIEHATPDAELAAAQLALGRPELADAQLGQGEPIDVGATNGDAGELVPAGGASVPDRQRGAAGRLINFLQGSWRELQRVQWPDRQQVMQATGVVLGFVIVAGVFLGVADLVATKVVNLILK